MCLEDKKYIAEDAAFAAPTASILGPAASGTLPKPEGSGASLSAILASRIFTDTQAHDMYKEFLNANNMI